MADTFEPGDVVRLKSGGPAMTVIVIIHGPKGEEFARLAWFDQQDTLKLLVKDNEILPTTLLTRARQSSATSVPVAPA